MGFIWDARFNLRGSGAVGGGLLIRPAGGTWSVGLPSVFNILAVAGSLPCDFRREEMK